MTCCVALISWATLANGLTVVLATKFFPELADGWGQKAVALGVVTFLTIVNLAGVKSGARVVQFFTVAKLIPIALFIIVGVFFCAERALCELRSSWDGSSREDDLDALIRIRWL